MKTVPSVVLMLVGLFAHDPARAAEPPTAPVLRIEAGMHTAGIGCISVDAAGRLALTASQDKTARIWELPSGRMLRILRPPVGEGSEGELYACGLSPDGALAAVAGWTGYEWDRSACVYLFDTATGRLLRRLPGLLNVIQDLAFSARGRYLAAVLAEGDGLCVWETSSGREIGRDTDYGKRDSQGVDWHGDDQIVTTCWDGALRLYELREDGLRRRACLPARGGKQPVSARFSPDGDCIAVGFADSTRVAVLDAADLGFRFAPDTAGVDNGSLGLVAWTRDGTTLAAGGQWHLRSGDSGLRLWPQSGRGKPRDFAVVSNTILDLKALPDGGMLFCAGDPAWGVLSADGERTLYGQSPVADPRGWFDQLRFSTDAAVVAFGYEPFGKGPARYSVKERRIEIAPTKEASIPLHAPRLTGLKVSKWQDSVGPRLNGQLLPIKPHEISRCLAIASDGAGFLLGTDWALRSFMAKGEERWRVPAPAATWAVNLAADDQLAMAAYGDGTIRWYRADTGQELLAFLPHADRKRWVAWTPQGYYDTSPEGEGLIGWHVNRGRDKEADFFPAAKFRDRFYRPDVISLVLETRDVSAALEAANKAAGRVAPAAAPVQAFMEMAPPVVELALGGARREISVPLGVENFTLRYRVRRAGSEPVIRLRLLVDGRPVSVEAPVPENDTAEATVSAPLPTKDCVLEVLAENRFAVSEPATLRIIRPGGPAPAETAVLKPKLYLLAAGITDYLNNDQLDDLHFAAKDAEDFAQAFQRQEGGLYQKVEAKVLRDKEATAANILDGLDWIKGQTTGKDVAVIFFSGHGENDEELRYYFCPHDYDKARRLRSGISFEAIQKTVSSLPGKVLFFIDSCHAGNALGKLHSAKSTGAPVDVTRLVNELAGAENGAIVFTSSTGRQVSLELAEEKNGAFTKAIVEGLEGQADLLRTGKITVASLEAFVAERVKELTEGQQSPTVAKPQTVPDFPIALKR
ncbi:MAG: hypothetical protein QOE70_1030 [Chthoniobacter sp.]|jgi:hypothetical protein|nr:hypothetical protein [Chthoniobacter sp.]